MSFLIVLVSPPSPAPPPLRPVPGEPIEGVSSIITKGYIQSKVITWGYGGTGGVQPPPTEPDVTPWTETECTPPPTTYAESQCAPGNWTEEGDELQRILVTPGGSFREANWLTEESPAPPIVRLGGTRPSGRDRSPLLRRVMTPVGRPHTPTPLLVTPGGSHREQQIPGVLVKVIQGVADTEDLYVREDLATSNFGTATTIFMKHTTSNNERVTAIRFPAHGIPTGSAILNAVLTIYWRSANTVAIDTVLAHRMLATWDEGTSTWATTGGFENAGVDYSLTSVGSGAWLGGDTVEDAPFNLDVKDVVQEMITNGDTDLSFRMNWEGANSPTSAWNSSESGRGDGVAPKIEIIYAE